MREDALEREGLLEPGDAGELRLPDRRHAAGGDALDERVLAERLGRRRRRLAHAPAFPSAAGAASALSLTCSSGIAARPMPTATTKPARVITPPYPNAGSRPTP